MRYAISLTSANVFIAIVAVLFCGSSLFPIPANAQGQGQNAVYPASGTCCVGSTAFIDASMFAAQGIDFCGVLKSILISNSYPPAGAVIDARGVPFTTPPTSMKCGASPWAGITNPLPSVILLPAGNIVIPSTWILPPNTRLIGEGSNITSSGFTPGTTLQAQSGFTSGSPMISFGQSSLCTSTCAGISVENLTLDGQGQFIHGIDNAGSQDSSYVMGKFIGRDEYTAFALRAGVKVGPANRFFGSGYMGGARVSGTVTHHTSFFGPWANNGKGVKNRYLGLKFVKNGKPHYGWARISVSKYPFVETLTGYAYETIPNKSIIAGATKGPDDDAQQAPAGITTRNAELATLGMLALGAPGLTIWRREEPAAGTQQNKQLISI